MTHSSFPFTISPSTSFLTLHTEEVGENSWVEFDVFHAGAPEKAPRVRITFRRCLGARMLGMGGEARDAIGVLVHSTWLSELADLQRRHYPAHPNNFADVRHFYFRGHDATVEVLAEDCAWTFVRDSATSGL